MKALLRFVTSSIGKKMVMAISGLLLCGFLVGHLLGNLLMYKSAAAFDMYAHTLQANPLLVPIELVLAGIFLTHAIFACWVRYENWVARPAPYAVDRSIGDRGVASATMLYTGVLILGFLVVHLINFKYGPIQEGRLFDLVMDTFRVPFWAGVYIAMMVVLGIHLSHGVRSAFQSLGVLCSAIDHPIRKLGLAFAIVVGGGFLLFPVWAYFR